MGFIHKIIISFSLFLTLSAQLHAQISNFVSEPGEWSFLGADGRDIIPSSDAILSDSTQISIIWKYDKTSGWSAYSPDTSMNLGSYSNPNMTIAQGKGFWVKWKNTSIINVTIPTTMSGTKTYTSGNENGTTYDLELSELAINGSALSGKYYLPAQLAWGYNSTQKSTLLNGTVNGTQITFATNPVPNPTCTHYFTGTYSNSILSGTFTTLNNCNGSGTFSFTTIPTTQTTFNVSSTSFTNGNVLPLKYTATAQGGQNVSPQLSWSGTQTNIGKYAVIVDDETSPCGTGDGACVHWNVFNIPASTTSFTENQSISAISGAIVGYTYNGQLGYHGPNPPSAHTYKITVYALSSSMPTISTSQLSSFGYTLGMTRSQFEYQFSNYILNKSTMSTVFTPIN